MKNIVLIDLFLEGKINIGTTSSMHVKDNKLYSYGHVMIYKGKTGIYLNATNYGRTTSKHQDMVRTYKDKLHIKEVYELELQQIIKEDERGYCSDYKRC